MNGQICEDMDYYGIESVTEDHNNFGDFASEIKITTRQEVIDRVTTMHNPTKVKK